MTKRNKLEIIKDILAIIKFNNNSIKITPLIRKSNLSSARFSEYFNEMKEKKFVKEARDNKGSKYLSLTEKGIVYLEKYKTIMDFIDEFDL